MKIRADLTERAAVDADDLDWISSPSEGVERKMLERDGDEIARATSLVRFAPGASFPHHSHGGGEEFFVLEGVFSDEDGDVEAGTYVRHPIGSEHEPYSEPGCVILVKLRQMHDPDEGVTVVRPDDHTWVSSSPGIETMMLHDGGPDAETVRLERWAPGASPGRREAEGLEYFVLDGAFRDDRGNYRTGSWLRLPPGMAHRPETDEGCRVWVKCDHLGRET